MHLSILMLAMMVGGALAHGRVTQPASRASAWRAGFPTRPDYDDDGVNCGGMWHQWSHNRGRCGICGDRYDAQSPRPHELGGTFGQGVIVAHYLPSSVITISVQLTTSHLGFWVFNLCPDPKRNEQDCFDQYPLELEDGGTVFYPSRGSTKYDVNYRLPPGLVCDHCVLQWRYTAGNNWGVCNNGTQGLGCGNQEQFGACSDVSIGMSNPRMGTKSDVYGDLHSPMLYYLSRGYFDVQNGILHIRKDEEPVPHSESKASRHKNKLKQRKNKKKQKPQKQKKDVDKEFILRDRPIITIDSKGVRKNHEREGTLKIPFWR